jgi:hypothetical protein
MKSDTGPFTLIPEWVLDSGISPRALQLYAMLGRYADEDGACWPARSTLAARMRCSSDVVDRAKNELLEIEALEWEQQTTDLGTLTSNRYRLIRAAPTRLGGRKIAAGGSRESASENENHLEREPIGGLAAESAAPENAIQTLIAGFVDDYRVVCDGHDPPRAWRGAAGKAVKTAVKDGETSDDIAVCLGLIAKEGKHPSTLQYVLSDMHANRPRRVQR